ncbi:nitric oxide synthase 1-like isoform X1 [Clavelina lepadiformis]|uniref:nitric oxide synthase 1-like isoform X1 n=1 Tax=Clavelina lepadiformis TaxID=159417 RepID=UPI004041FFAD
MDGSQKPRNNEILPGERAELRNPSSSKQRFETLKNWETDKVQRDTLHLKACPVNVCDRAKCNGSVMNPSQMISDPRNESRSPEDIVQLATDFIDQYYESAKRFKSEAHLNRLHEVKQSIKGQGTFTLTEHELIFGAKTAWRNAPRCIGRIQWNKLQVFDCRHITSTAEMFEAICTHLKYATNKGNIRSCITFFPPRNEANGEFRVWNPQLIRYAGYRQLDGSVIGDPVNVEFTQICERLGWVGKGGRFDVLPLLLQANSKDPDMYEVPTNLVLEVDIKHPKFDWLEKMGLKWYAVPAVSNMLIDIGGIQFPACPFNGWFMGTEIGRDLCDTTRYNILEPLAKQMGLHTKNNSSLWKDKAVLELNISILHSFQSNNVTIMDHHAATESFMKHFSNELRLRGGCPGDWVWLVPPVSGSTTPIFHQEIFNYILNPTCYYQPDAWKLHTLKNRDQKVGKTKKIHFKELARFVLLASTMMTKAMAKRVKATIFYATETGKSLTYAKILREIFNHAFDAKIVAMDEYDIWLLEYESLVLVVTSTFGNGDPPENGETFAQALQDMGNGDNESSSKKFDSVNTVAPLQKRVSFHAKNTTANQDNTSEEQGILANVKFSVFGLGSRAYPNFCAFGHAIDTMLGDMKAERLLEIGEGDELSGQEDSFRHWAQNVFSAACDSFCLKEDVNIEIANASLSNTTYHPSNYRFKSVDIAAEENITGDLGKMHKKHLSSCRLIERINLQSAESKRSTILVKLDTNDSPLLDFEPGDHLGIYPCNQPELVDGLISKLEDAPAKDDVIQMETLKRKNTHLGIIENWEADVRLPPCSLRTALTRFLDITTPPTPQILSLLAECAQDENEKTKLKVLSEGSFAYEDWKFQSFPNFLEILEEFPSIKLSSSLLLSQLPFLQCRYYSISSSPNYHPGQIHCTVSVVSYTTKGGSGPVHHGVCSSYLNRIPAGEKISCFIRHASGFRLPKDPSTPCLLIGPGTGIAPFRSFWQQRIYETSSEAKVNGTMALLFGCRHPLHDHLYKKEVEEAKKLGVISHSYTAFSRSPHTPKTYVQHILENEISDFVFDSIHNRNGHFYVCGDVTMAADVNRAFKSVLVKNGMMKEDSDNYIRKMKSDNRYHEDIFGVTLRTSEVTDSVRKHVRKNSIKPL